MIAVSLLYHDKDENRHRRVNCFGETEPQARASAIKMVERYGTSRVPFEIGPAKVFDRVEPADLDIPSRPD